jgi:glycosyltransferase involved in cell wall biosynthesis
MKVSILIPAYNSEKYIAETIQCAINQTWPDKEIIVVDDGSSDNTYEIAKQFESDNIKIFKQDNKGASAARNNAFSKSSGELIQYLDADDLLSPNKIEEQIKIYLNNPDPRNIVTCNFLYFTDNIVTGLEFPRCQFITTGYGSSCELLIDIFDYVIGTQTSMWLVHRELIEKSGGWNEQLSLNDDGEFFFRIISMSKTVHYCANAIVYYRMPINGLSKRRDIEAAKSQLLSTRIMRDIILSYSKSKRARLACCKFYLRHMHQFDDNGNFDKMAEKDIKDLGFHVETLFKTKRYKIMRNLFGKKIYKSLFPIS